MKIMDNYYYESLSHIHLLTARSRHLYQLILWYPSPVVVTMSRCGTWQGSGHGYCTHDNHCTICTMEANHSTVNLFKSLKFTVKVLNFQPIVWKTEGFLNPYQIFTNDVQWCPWHDIVHCKHTVQLCTLHRPGFRVKVSKYLRQLLYNALHILDIGPTIH